MPFVVCCFCYVSVVVSAASYCVCLLFVCLCALLHVCCYVCLLLCLSVVFIVYLLLCVCCCCMSVVECVCAFVVHFEFVVLLVVLHAGLLFSMPYIRFRLKIVQLWENETAWFEASLEAHPFTRGNIVFCGGIEKQ